MSNNQEWIYNKNIISNINCLNVFVCVRNTYNEKKYKDIAHYNYKTNSWISDNSSENLNNKIICWLLDRTECGIIDLKNVDK